MIWGARARDPLSLRQASQYRDGEVQEVQRCQRRQTTGCISGDMNLDASGPLNARRIPLALR